ncbi:MAG: glucose-6-phosphate dehydrogenase assembly protein OpcA [Mycobacteriales bacterium]
MTTTLWDTTGTEVVRALSAERRAGGAVASGLALTLVVVSAERDVPAAEQAATIAAAAHPCRLLMVVRRQADATDRLDAEVAVGGRLGATEAVVMRMYGALTGHAESVVLPLLAPDTPVVTWWHGAPPERIGDDPLGLLADRRITDCALAGDPLAALAGRAGDFAPGDTDLAWTRTTKWRALLASAFDGADFGVDTVIVQAEPANPSAALLAAWLGSRLGLAPTREDSVGPGITSVSLATSAGNLQIHRPSGGLATYSRDGQPDRELPLPRRALGELLAEELRRLDPDVVYADALGAATGLVGLTTRPPRQQAEQAEAGQTGAAQAAAAQAEQSEGD